MKVEQTELDGGILKVTLDGALDVAGAGDADAPLGAIAGSRDKVIVDFSKLTFIASIGVRVLLKTAKPIANRGGKLVIVNPDAPARKILTSIGIDAFVPIFDDEAGAVAALR